MVCDRKLKCSCNALAGCGEEDDGDDGDDGEDDGDGEEDVQPDGSGPIEQLRMANSPGIDVRIDMDTDMGINLARTCAQTCV